MCLSAHYSRYNRPLCLILQGRAMPYVVYRTQDQMTWAMRAFVLTSTCLIRYLRQCSEIINFAGAHHGAKHTANPRCSLFNNQSGSCEKRLPGITSLKRPRHFQPTACIRNQPDPEEKKKLCLAPPVHDVAKDHFVMLGLLLIRSRGRSGFN